ncbi:MAG: hypothetical protein ABUK01_05950 [Leptospirales bacterium]
MKQKMIESVRLLAANYTDQIKVFPQEVNIPDEIANIFDECYSSISLSDIREWLDTSQLSILKEMNSLLDQMSDHCKECWSLESLESGDKWKQARRIAKRWLESLSSELKQPDLFWINYTV